MIQDIALGLLTSGVAVSGTARLIVDIAMYFGLFVIVAMALNFQYGNAGIPNMGCAVQVIVGGFTVSALTTRLIFSMAKSAGVELRPWADDFDWVYNNPFNVDVTNTFIKDKPMFGMSMLLFSLAVALILGAVIGWIIALPAIRLRATYLMIVLITMADASQIFGRNIPWISGGTLGVFIPDIFKWYQGDRTILMAIITLLIGLVSFFIFRTMLNSPYGRLMRSIRENEITVGSVGKNVVGIRRNILMFASGITALSGTLLAFYFSYVVEANYQRAFWTYWPWLMLILGGPGNNAGTFLGCALVVAMRRVIIVNKWFLQEVFFFPIAYFESILLGVLLLVVIIFRPNGLIPEKLLYIPGVNYRRLVDEEVVVDWRDASKSRGASSGISGIFRTLGGKKEEAGD
ncbi:branched-chain amino acid ABC transporter permease, partial [Candidatus Bathyarchaeota archaeon]|nr:branched-chain amino acid ABC transporter permease [Candidatus Bathyarchaeota archaeon]